MLPITNWRGEANIEKYNNLLGWKCLIILMMNEFNRSRIRDGLQPFTLQQVIAQMDALMEQYKSDLAD